MTTDIDKRVLSRAILIYQKKQWIQNRFFSEDQSGCCATGALLLAAQQENVQDAWHTIDLVTYVTRLRDARGMHSLAVWNDVVATCKQDVIDLFKQAMDHGS